MGEKLLQMLSGFLNKKTLIKWGSAALFVAAAAAAGMQTQEFKDAVCSAPAIQPETK